MPNAQEILRKLGGLAPEDQKRVLDFIESLQDKHGERQPLQSLEGLWANLGFDISEEDIAEARREMWGNFPRDFS